MPKRPTMYCDTCESTVYADDLHSCHDAKALRAQQARERAITDAERRVVEAAEAMHDVLEPPRTENYREFRNASDALVTAVRALRAVRGGSHP